MHIINLIDNLDQVNYGIWNAAVSSAPFLHEQFGAISHVWYPATDLTPHLSNVKMKSFKRLDIQNLFNAISEGGFTPETTVIVSHGCWRFPTRWAHELHKRGYKWVMVPHGMLEPWSMQQKRIKKTIYFRMVELPMIKNADAVRAVGSPEWSNLNKFKSISPILIPNGISSLSTDVSTSKSDKRRDYLFMARIHHKKGIIPLVKSWLTSSLSNDPNYYLTIAGPDDGALNTLLSILNASKVNNIQYVGAVYDNEKIALLKRCHFYVLPSYSEGFPTSLLEAMQYGMIPLMTKGCNFPEALEKNLAIEITPETEAIRIGLEKSKQIKDDEWSRWSAKSAEFVNVNYNLSNIASQLFELYSNLLGQSK